MRAILQIYRRYFGGLKVWLLLAMVLVVTEASVPYMVAALGRYTVDEVLEVKLQSSQNHLDAVVAGPEGQTKLQTGQVGGYEPTIVGPEQEVVGQNSADLVQGQADRLTVGDEQQRRPAEFKESVLLKNGKSRAQKVGLLVRVFIITLMVYLLLGAYRIGQQYLLGWTGEQIVFRLRRALHKKLQQLSMTYHDQHEKGRLMSRVTDDVDVLRQMATGLGTAITSNIFTILVGLVVIFSIDLKLSFIALATLPIFGLTYGSFRTRMQQLWRELARQRAGIYGLVGDRLASPETVKSFGQERRETLRLFGRCRELLMGQIKQAWLEGLFGLLRGVLCGVSMAVVLGYGLLLVRDGKLSVGYLLFFYGSLGLMYKPVAVLSGLVSDTQRYRVSAERVLEILDEPVTIRDVPGAIDLPMVAGLIRLRNVSLQYPSSEEPALKDISLVIEPGQRVCLMGSSGAGKTSLVNVLLRLYEPNTGVVRLDGRDLREIKLGSLRDHVGYVPQDAFLFTGTVRDNIRYGNLLASQEQVEKAARAAELHEFIKTLPDGYDTIVGERGVTLSGGQRQRVSLARALLTDPRVLILDDCTSALDAITEARIIRTLRTALAGRTTVIITHRVSMSSRSDRVVVLKEGRVAEIGSHEELLVKEGAYFDLVAEQLAEKDLRAKSGRVLSVAG